MSEENPDPIIESLSAEVLAALEQREPPIQLTLWPDDERAMPGDFIACALFTASKTTTYVTRCKLASVHGLSVIFTGKRLTQVHADVWMGIMHLARHKSSGDYVRFRDRELLELIGRYTLQHQREQLKDWISQLAATDVLIQDDQKKTRFGGSLLPWRREQDGEYFDVYRIQISRALAEVLSGGRHHQIDWPLRKALQRKPLALWLQTFFARFARSTVKVAHLHELSGSGASLKKFRENLGHALDALHAEGGYSAVIDRETDIIVPTRRPAPPKPRKPKHDGQAELPFAPLRLVK
jgi:hypothetical protein